MFRILLVLLFAVPVALQAQDTTSCAPLANDLNGDFIVGATDILQLLSAYGENYDVDGDSIPDCDDPCVGEYDECGVCNGPGPQVLAIESIVVILDSVYVDAIDDWLVYELDRDTILELVCENPGCSDPFADNYDPYAQEDGSCTYEGFDCLVQFMMYDVAGDGWDGTMYTLTNSEGEVAGAGSLDDAQFTIAEGAQGYDVFCLSETECYTLELSGGAFPGDKGWQIIDYNTGQILFDQTNGDGFGIFNVAAPGVECGCTDSTALNYNGDATADDGSCLLEDCGEASDSTSYILNLTHDFSLTWGDNSAIIYDLSSGDTLLEAGYVDGLMIPDYAPNPMNVYYVFCVPNDACLQFSSGGGATAGQPSWAIMDWSGNILHEGGLGVYSIGFGSETDCVAGCTLTAAINYNPFATIDDGSCVVCDNGQLGLYLTLQDDEGDGWDPLTQYSVTDVETGEIVLNGSMDSGPTTTELVHCLDIGCYSFNTDSLSTGEGWGITDNLGNVYAPLTYGSADDFFFALGGPDVTDCAFPGCMDSGAQNYNATANLDDGSCEFSGCTESTAWNFDATANVDDGTCQANACGVEGELVVATNFEFTPSELSISTGTTVVWQNESTSLHNVNGDVSTLTGESFGNPVTFNLPNNFGNLDGTCMGSVTFSVPGVYSYDCSIGAHAAFGMVGTITVGIGGCTDSSASNFNPAAEYDDGSCAIEVASCEDEEMDGHTYSVVEIGDQCWFAENLRTTVYANGDVIPAGLTDGEWTSTTAGATAVHGEGSSACSNSSPDIDACDEAQSLAEYGRLYNWYAVDDVRGLCPAGWHVPTDGEWTELEDYITAQGFDGVEGTALKSTTGWSGGNGTNDFGFAAFPGGSRNYVNGDFGGTGNYGYWWSSSPDGGAAWRRVMSYSYSFIFRGSINLRDGFSVRCLRDAE